MKISKKLRIKLSTAKSIVSKYRKTGKIFETKKAEQKRLQQAELNSETH